MESGSKSPRQCLIEVVDATAPRKVFAYDHGMSEAQFSKVLGGSSTARYDIDFLQHLDTPTLCRFLNRYGEERGFRVRPVDPDAVAEAIVEAVQKVVQLTRVAATLHAPQKAHLRRLRASRRVVG